MKHHHYWLIGMQNIVWMRHVLKYKKHHPDTPTHMQALSGENRDEYYKAIDDEIHSLMRRETWEIVSSNSVADNNVLRVKFSFKCKRKHYRTIRKLMARYYVRGDVQQRLSPEPLNSYSSVVQWATLRLTLILQCIIGFQSNNIDFKNDLAQADIPSGEPLYKGFNSDLVQRDVVLRLKKSLYGEAKFSRLWDEKC